MSKKLTRRQWTATLTAAAASVPALAQRRPAENPADLLAQTRQLNENHRKALAAFKFDRSVEPAFHFEA